MLSKLPNEILSHIVTYLDTARDLRNIGLSSSGLSKFVESAGWKIFASSRFPSISLHSSNGKEAAHALTTLSRNLDRRAFLTTVLKPAGSIHHLPYGFARDWDGPPSRSQSMGYQAVLDSYEACEGNSLDSRKEVIAWGAGAALVVKVCDHGNSQWLIHNDQRLSEGYDDITCVKALRPHQRGFPNNADTDEATSCEYVVAGRASGLLHLYDLGTHAKSGICETYSTANQAVRSADISTDKSPMLATCLGDHRLAIYAVRRTHDTVQPISESTCGVDFEPGSRTWAIKFLSKDNLAVSYGSSKTIVSVYSLLSTGLSSDPIRTFGLAQGEPRTSAYPVIRLPGSTHNKANEPAFLSGGYDGKIRLHDMRSSRESEASFHDPIDATPVYALESVGRERVVAGAAQNTLLKVFDLRMTGGRAYSYLDAQASTNQRDEEPSRSQKSDAPLPQQVDPHSEWMLKYTSGWNVYPGGSLYPGPARRLRPPVYSLSRPSPSSPYLYTGLEGKVIQFNFTAALDQHPDPRFWNPSPRASKKSLDPIAKWFPDVEKSINLIITLHVTGGRFELLNQRSLYRGKRAKAEIQWWKDTAINGYDERYGWKC